MKGKKMNKTNIFDKLHTALIYLLSSPLIVYHYLAHLYEAVRMREQKYADKLFMCRFRLLDRQHINDFIRWNNNYREDRLSNKEIRIRIKNNEADGWVCEGMVTPSVVRKIKNNEFVEFNLRVGDYDEYDTATYQRYHYSPVKDMEVEIFE